VIGAPLVILENTTYGSFWRPHQHLHKKNYTTHLATQRVVVDFSLSLPLSILISAYVLYIDIGDMFLQGFRIVPGIRFC
jgi:hypothetical protein